MSFNSATVFIDDEQQPPLDWGVTVALYQGPEIGVHICAMTRENALALLQRAVEVLEREVARETAAP